MFHIDETECTLFQKKLHEISIVINNFFSSRRQPTKQNRIYCYETLK
jgi:hypothetical protein